MRFGRRSPLQYNRIESAKSRKYLPATRYDAVLQRLNSTSFRQKLLIRISLLIWMSAVIFAEDQSPDLQPLRPLGVTYTVVTFFPRHDDSPLGIAEPVLEPVPHPIVFSPQANASGPITQSIDSYVITGNETTPGPYTGTSSGSAPILSDLAASSTSLDPRVQQVPEPSTIALCSVAAMACCAVGMKRRSRNVQS